MQFQPGDIVVKKWSRAQTLKPKVFKIIGSLSTTEWQPKYQVVNAYGKQKVMSEYRLESLINLLSSAKEGVSILQQQVTRAQNRVHNLEQEIKEVSKYFPKV